MLKIVIPIYALAGGAASALLHTLLYYKLIYGVTAIFLPHFGLAFAGLSYGRSGLNAAMAVAIPALLLLLPWQDAIIIIVTQIIPLNLFIRCLMMAAFRANPALNNVQLIWSPPCYAVSYVCLYGAIFYAMVIITQGALYENMSAPMVKIIQISADELQLKTLVKYVHLLVGLDFCLNLLNIMLVIFLLHGYLRRFNAIRRPVLRFASPSTPPDIMLVIGLAAALIAIIGEGKIAQAGECALLILLTPYLYSGLSHIHFTLQFTRDKKIWFTLFYIALLLFNATALLMIAVYGLATHASRFSLRLKS